MNLWLVLTVFGEIGGTWGPLPYDMAQCRANAVAMIAEIDAGIAANPKVDAKPGDFVAYCVEQETRPPLDAMEQLRRDHGYYTGDF